MIIGILILFICCFNFTYIRKLGPDNKFVFKLKGDELMTYILAGIGTIQMSYTASASGARSSCEFLICN